MNKSIQLLRGTAIVYIIAFHIYVISQIEGYIF